jgi:hypothetical protein
MNGVESFVSQNFSEHDSTFNSCLHLIIYGYSLLEQSKKYSRKDILELTSTIRGKETNKVELEDFLRNDLVENYIEPNRCLFGLNNHLFISGAEEFLDNVKTGILDIKVTSPLWNGNTYFIFECKRLNKTILDNYITEGVSRFIKEGKYYPKFQNSVAGMISFLEHVDIKHEIKCNDAFYSISNVLQKYQDATKISENLLQYKLDCKTYKYIDEFQYVFKSIHLRGMLSIPINIFHIVLDYNYLVLD